MSGLSVCSLLFSCLCYESLLFSIDDFFWCFECVIVCLCVLFLLVSCMTVSCLYFFDCFNMCCVFAFVCLLFYVFCLTIVAFVFCLLLLCVMFVFVCLLFRCSFCV